MVVRCRFIHGFYGARLTATKTARFSNTGILNVGRLNEVAWSVRHMERCPRLERCRRPVPSSLQRLHRLILTKRASTMPTTLPLFPLNTVLFPGMPLPLRVFEERYLRMLEEHRDADPIFGVVLIKSGRESGSIPEVHLTGTAVSLASDRHRMSKRGNIVVTGGSRFHINDLDWSREYGLASIDYVNEPAPDPSEIEGVLRGTKDLLRRYVRGITRLTGRRFDHVRLPVDPVACSWELAARLPLHSRERQSLLEQPLTADRLKALRYILRRELALLYGAGAAGLAMNHPGGSFTLN